MSRVFVVRNVASVANDTHTAAQKVRIANGAEMGNVQSIPKLRRSSSVSTPQHASQLANAKHRTHAEQSARIAKLETDLQNLWHHYASSRRQKLDLLDANSSLETEICVLKRELAYETNMRSKAEAKLQSGGMPD